MKFFLLTLLTAALLWIASIAWTNRRKPPHGNRSEVDSGGGDAGSGCFSSSCDDGGCGGGDGGGD